MSQALPVTIGVVADTHIPDRVNSLHPRLLETLRAANVQHILHAGDISLRPVLVELAQVAPVTAVRGNRDMLIHGLRMIEQLEFNGVQIALTHGHGGLWPYLRDKVWFLLRGYQLERYQEPLIKAAGAAEVIVYGHTHFPENLWYAGKLFFNPGSASFGVDSRRHPGLQNQPSIGLLHLTQGEPPRAEHLPLRGYEIRERTWVEIYQK